MKTSLALLAATILVAPAIATASQPAQPAGGQDSPQTQAPAASATASPANDSCSSSTAQAGKTKKDSHAGKGVTSSTTRDESVAAITRDTGDSPPAKAKKPANDGACGSQ
jgi:hypothetical protein